MKTDLLTLLFILSGVLGSALALLWVPFVLEVKVSFISRRFKGYARIGAAVPRLIRSVGLPGEFYIYRLSLNRPKSPSGERSGGKPKEPPEAGFERDTEGLGRRIRGRRGACEGGAETSVRARSPSGMDVIRLLWTERSRILGVIRYVVGRTRWDKLEWITAIGLGDAAATGLAVGSMWAMKGNVLVALQGLSGISPESVRIQVFPDFLRQRVDFRIEFKVRVAPVTLLMAGYRAWRNGLVGIFWRALRSNRNIYPEVSSLKKGIGRRLHVRGL